MLDYLTCKLKNQSGLKHSKKVAPYNGEVGHTAFADPVLTAVIILNALHKKIEKHVFFFNFLFSNCMFNEALSEGFNDEAGHCNCICLFLDLHTPDL